MTARRGPRGATPTEPDTTRHIPVLLSEVIESLGPSDGDVFIDATFGAGGLLARSSKCCRLSRAALSTAIRARLPARKACAREFRGRLTRQRDHASPSSTRSHRRAGRRPRRRRRARHRRLLDATRPTSNAASPFRPTARSTCACRARAGPQPMSSTAWTRRSSHASSTSWARSVARAQSRVPSSRPEPMRR